MEISRKQLMVSALSREIRDGETYIIGTGLPLLGAVLAKNTHAPNCHLIFETAIFDSFPLEIPKGVSDLRLTHGAELLWPQYRYFGFQRLAAERGQIAAGFLGGAQIDPYGNLNSTSIGDYLHPDTRFPGSGGANGIATYCDTVITMKHERRRFCEHIDYVTSPGWGDGPFWRQSVGLVPDRGPQAVITDLCVLRFDKNDKRMYLSELFPGVSPKSVAENTGFQLDLSRAETFPCPDKETIDILAKQMRVQ